jgi:hypothetical protein
MGHHIIACCDKKLNTAFASMHLSAHEGFAGGNIYEVLGANDKRNSCSGNGTFSEYRPDPNKIWPVQPNVAAIAFIDQVYTHLERLKQNLADQVIYIYFG